MEALESGLTIMNMSKSSPWLDGIEKSVSAYYSSLSDEEVREQAEWGEFALGEFPSEPAEA
jgi:hypothetical protein